MVFFTLLATAVGIVSVLGLVIVGLVEAPWQVLLLGLLSALYALQRQVWASESAAQLSNADISPTIAPNPGQASVPAKPELVKPEPSASAQSASSDNTEAADDSYELTYRGIRYRPSHATPEGSSAEQAAKRSGAKTEGIYRGQPWQR